MQADTSHKDQSESDGNHPDEYELNVNATEELYVYDDVPEDVVVNQSAVAPTEDGEYSGYQTSAVHDANCDDIVYVTPYNAYEEIPPDSEGNGSRVDVGEMYDANDDDDDIPFAVLPDLIWDDISDDEGDRVFISVDGVVTPVKTPRTKAGLQKREKRTLNKTVEVLGKKVPRK